MRDRKIVSSITCRHCTEQGHAPALIVGSTAKGNLAVWCTIHRRWLGTFELKQPFWGKAVFQEQQPNPALH